MKLNKEQFLKTEFGSELECTITAWNQALEKHNSQNFYYGNISATEYFRESV